MKKHLLHFATGAVSTAMLPVGAGLYDWRIISGAAVAGGVCGLFGINLAGRIRRYAAKRKAPAPE
jgi:hypothetical protein